MKNSLVRITITLSILLTPVLGMGTCLKKAVVEFDNGEFIKQIGCERLVDGDAFCLKNYGPNYLAVKTLGCELTPEFNFSPEIVREIEGLNAPNTCNEIAEEVISVAAVAPAVASSPAPILSENVEWKKYDCENEGLTTFGEIRVEPLVFSDGKCNLQVTHAYMSGYTYQFRDDGRLNISTFDNRTSSAWHAYGEKYYYLSGARQNDLLYRYDEVRKVLMIKLPQGQVITINQSIKIDDELSDVSTISTPMNLTRVVTEADRLAQNLGIGLHPKRGHLIESNLVKGDLGDWISRYTSSLEGALSTIITPSKLVKVTNKTLWGAANKESENYFELSEQGRKLAERLAGQ